MVSGTHIALHSYSLSSASYVGDQWFIGRIFSKAGEAPAIIRTVIDAFEEASHRIDSFKLDLPSNDVLA